LPLGRAVGAEGAAGWGQARGANAVVDIVSYYKKNEFKSASNYECYAGSILAGVALKGTYAKVAGK
jgi:hypothetical protein